MDELKHQSDKIWRIDLQDDHESCMFEDDLMILNIVLES